MNDPVVPKFYVSADGASIHITIPQTDALLKNQGYTYNQAGFTYNQAGVMYGGVYNYNEDMVPQFFNETASIVTPSISAIVDVYKPFVPVAPNHGMLIGILGLTYP